MARPLFGLGASLTSVLKLNLIVAIVVTIFLNVFWADII